MTEPLACGHPRSALGWSATSRWAYCLSCPPGASVAHPYPLPPVGRSEPAPTASSRIAREPLAPLVRMEPRPTLEKRATSIYARPVRLSSPLTAATAPTRRVWIGPRDGWSAFALAYTVGSAALRGPVDDLLRVLRVSRVHPDLIPAGEHVLVRSRPVVAMWWPGEPLPPLPPDALVVLTRYAEARPLMVDLGPPFTKEYPHAR